MGRVGGPSGPFGAGFSPRGRLLASGQASRLGPFGSGFSLRACEQGVYLTEPLLRAVGGYATDLRAQQIGQGRESDRHGNDQADAVRQDQREEGSAVRVEQEDDRAHAARRPRQRSASRMPPSQQRERTAAVAPRRPARSCTRWPSGATCLAGRRWAATSSPRSWACADRGLAAGGWRRSGSGHSAGPGNCAGPVAGRHGASLPEHGQAGRRGARAARGARVGSVAKDTRAARAVLGPSATSARTPSRPARGRAGAARRASAGSSCSGTGPGGCHYDLRFEIDGVLVSWAVPNGPTLDPAVKRLAVHVEDHPIEYIDFEGVIPAGEYGGGDVIVWDLGTWEPHATDDPAAAVAAGELHVDVTGHKLRGRLILVRSGGRGAVAAGAARDRRTGGGESEQWLLLHKDDDDGGRAAGTLRTTRGRCSAGGPTTRCEADPDRLWRSDLPPGQASIALRPPTVPGPDAGRARRARRARRQRQLGGVRPHAAADQPGQGAVPRPAGRAAA